MTKTMTRWGGVAAILAAAATFASAPAAADDFPVFGLPAAPGQDISSAGIHSDDGSTGVKNAIDLNPSDDVVRAPLDGTVRLQHCDGGDWVTIDHAGGWRTGYYHLVNIVVLDGQSVRQGDVLGDVGDALPCGGSASGAHLHFTLWQLDATDARSWDHISYDHLATTVANDVGVPLDGRAFGGWTLEEGADQYSGTATNAATGEVVPLPGSFHYAAIQSTG